MPRIVLFNGGAAGGPGPWVTDGTLVGTKDLVVTPSIIGNDGPSEFTPIHGKYVFAASADPSHAGLWVTDGTATGTALLATSRDTPFTTLTVGGGGTTTVDFGSFVQNIIVVPFQVKPRAFTRTGGAVVYVDATSDRKLGLWTTDGTVAGTAELVVAGASQFGIFQPADRYEFGSLGQKALFAGLDAAGQSGLWATDGSGAGTVELQVAGAAAAGLRPTNFNAIDGRMLFSGDDDHFGRGVWSTDGTSAGTTEIFDGTSSSMFEPSLVRVRDGSRLLFAGTDTTSGYGFYLTNGTRTGTSKFLAPVVTSASYSNFGSFGAAGSRVVYAYWNDLYVADGTPAGTHELTIPNASVYGANPFSFTPFGNRMLFTGTDLANHTALWVTDGTSDGTIELAEISIAYGYGTRTVTVLDGKAVFDGVDPAGHHGVWVTDGTASGTSKIAGFGTSVAPTGLEALDPTVIDTTRPMVNYTDTTTGVSSMAASTLYTGPVSYLDHQYIWSGPDAVAIAATSANVFLHGGAADDALTAVAGSNVLDGGLGSNFLTGATGADGGTDTFFVDGRGVGETWSTVNNFHHGDAITLWGFVGGTSTGFDTTTHQGSFVIDGTAGYKGATIHSETNGTGSGINASFTISGLSVADAATKLTLSTGSVEGHAYLYVSYTG